MNQARTKQLQLIRELQPKLISHFLSVIDHVTISRAAEVMNITQPALSKSIKQLEDRIGVPLFERWPKGMRATPYGEILARRARLIEREVSYAVSEIQTLKGGASGSIRIGAGLVWGHKYLAPVIAQYQSIYRGVRIELRSGVISTLVPALLGGDLDIICVTLDFPDSAEIEKEYLVEIRHAIFTRMGHPLTKLQHVTAADLHRFGWVGLKDDYVGNNRLGSFFAASGLGPPNIRIEVGADLGMIGILASSDHVGMLPIVLESTAQAMGVVPIDVGSAQLWVSTAGAAYRRTSYPTPAINNFLAMLRATFEPHTRPQRA
jgi:DNA-binding transcriptional LysR family regulator